MSEQIFFQSEDVLITQARFVVHGQTYAMQSVTTIGREVVEPSRKGPIITIGVGIIAKIISLNDSSSSAFLGAFVGLIILVAGIIWLRSMTKSETSDTAMSSKVAPSIILAVLGFIVIVVSFGLFSNPTRAEWVILLISLAILIAGIRWLQALKATHFVILTSAAGESRVLSSTDEAWINRVLNALNQAIVARG